MFLQELWKKVNPLARRRNRRALSQLHSPEEIRAILWRERSRADRTGHVFSFVVFSLPARDADVSRASGAGTVYGRDGCAVTVDKDFAELAQGLFRRARSIDEIGWFDDVRIGAVLPDTGSEGARKFADDVCRLTAMAGPRPNCKMYTYPSDWFETDGKRNRQARFDHSPPGFNTVAFRKKHSYEPQSVSGKSVLVLEELARRREVYSSEPVEQMETLFVKPLPTWKRAMDIAGAVIALIVFSPVMLVTAIAIKLTSRGPVVFKQKRAGLGGKPFDFYKFRSMYVGAEAKKAELLAHNEQTGPVFKMANDPRVTPVGRFIRKWSIDELPQFWNVLKGDMTLVGPRPPTLDEVPHYMNWQRQRLGLTPGLTCIWQVSGRSEVGFDDWVRMDIQYARARSVFRDLQILVRTVPALISRRGAH